MEQLVLVNINKQKALSFDNAFLIHQQYNKRAQNHGYQTKSNNQTKQNNCVQQQFACGKVKAVVKIIWLIAQTTHFKDNQHKQGKLQQQQQKKQNQNYDNIKKAINHYYAYKNHCLAVNKI